jgi:hypothetical protein
VAIEVCTQPGDVKPDPGQRYPLSQTLTFATDSRDPFAFYGAYLLADFCGVTLSEPTSGPSAKSVDLYYGNDRQRDCRIRIPVSESYRLASVPSLPEGSDYGAASTPDAVFPFDLFQALYFWLADQANEAAPEASFDAHGRLIASCSAQEALGVREIPIVNHYLLLARKWLEVRCGLIARPLLPAGKRCVLVLSHDVDDPIDPADASHRLWLALKATRLHNPRMVFGCLRHGAHAFVRRISGCHDRFDLFEDILSAEDHYGFRSTFFFSPVSYVEGHRLDVVYDIAAPRFQQVMKHLVSGQWEIGLHISYNSQNGHARIAEERSKVEQVAKCPVRGSRHHYWHMGRPFWPALEQHEHAGLMYDSSIAFNDAPGYRLGIAYPFHPWNPLSQRAIMTLQIPTVFMDGNYFYSPGQTAENAIGRLELLFDRLKKAEGVAAIDWHEHTASPGSATYKEWGKAYLLLLERLAADHSIAVCSFAQLLELLNQRSGSQERCDSWGVTKSPVIRESRSAVCECDAIWRAI